MFITPLREVLIRKVETADPLSLIVLFLLLAFSEIGIPLPVIYESILVLAGYKAARGNLQFLLPAAVGFAGSFFGALLIYLFFFAYGPGLLEKFFKGRRLRIEALKKELGEKETLAVILGRFTPGLLGLTSVVAGALKLDFRKFLLGVVTTNIVWAAILVSAGYFWGEASLRYQSRLVVLLALAGILALLWLVKKVLAMIKKST